MKVFLVVIPLLFSLLCAAQDTDYCDPSLCGEDETHIACDNDGSFAADCSDDAHLLEIDEAAQRHFVKAHNEVRQKWANGEGDVDAKACRMATVQWDAELASLAEYNVKQCQMEHDECHSTKKYPNSGQNLFYTGFKGGDPPTLSDVIQQAIDDWESEGQHVDTDILEKYPDNYSGPTIGHFTMLAQETNVAVGCAISTYEDAQGFTIHLVACNYATTNFIGNPVYKICDSAAEKCKKTNSKFPALCSKSEHIKYN